MVLWLRGWFPGRSDSGFDGGCSTKVGGRHINKTVISIIAQFSPPDRWTPPALGQTIKTDSPTQDDYRKKARLLGSDTMPLLASFSPTLNVH